MPFGLFAVATFQSATAARPIHITDYRALVTIASPQISPGGGLVAFVKSVANFRTDKRITTLEIIDVRTRMQTPAATGPRSIASPHWAPNETEIAYISQDKRSTDQVFVTTLGGVTRQVTRTKNGVEQYAWSPKGDQIAYVTADEPKGNPAIDLFDIDDVSFLTDRKPMPSHIWVIPSAGGTGRRLTRGSWSVLETGAPFTGGPSDPSWSPDGLWIAFARQANAFNSDSDLSTIAAVNVATGEVKGLTGGKSYEYQPAFSPRVGVAAYLLPHGPTPLSVMDVWVAPLSGAPYALTGGLDRDITGFVWAGRDLIVAANDRLRRQLWRHGQDGKDTKLSIGPLSVTDFDGSSDGSVAFVASTGNTPPELFYMSKTATVPRQLTRLNERLSRFAVGLTSEFRWTSPDGEQCDGVVTYPPGIQPGQPALQAPLVVWVHGGPEGASLDQYVGMEGDYLRQTLAGEGYVVFMPNYRGSDNLGNQHEHAIYGDPGEGPAKDVLSGIDKLVELGRVDANRITIAGHSYGGYMTAWLISHDHRWKCAVVADGAVDWLQTYNFSSDGNLAWARDSLGGTPADPKAGDLYKTGSPITYADQISTPTFIITGTADQTVPVTESYELYHALKDRHVPVRFVGVPGAHHTPDSPNQYERFYALMAQWIRHWNPVK